MAYQATNNRGMSSNRGVVTSQASKSGSNGARKKLFSTGLFAPNKEGVKAIGSVQVKEDITIPAGSYINLYENDQRKTEAHPVYSLAVTEGKLKSQASK